MGKYGYSVFVGNLSRRVRRDDLKDTFRDMGRIIEVDIKTGYGKFYGFIFPKYDDTVMGLSRGNKYHKYDF